METVPLSSIRVSGAAVQSAVPSPVGFLLQL